MMAETPDFEVVIQRLAKVERQLRTLKISGILAVPLVAVGLLLASAQPSVSEPPLELRAQSFVVVDEAGEQRAHLRTDATGVPSLKLFGANGKVRASFGLNNNGMPHLTLRDADSTLARAHFGLDDAGAPNLSLIGDPKVALWNLKDNIDIQLAAVLGINGKAPYLELYDEDDKERCTLGLSEDGSAGLYFRDEQGQNRLTMGAFADHTVVNVLGNDGRVRATLNAGPEKVALALANPGGSVRVAMYVSENGGAGLVLRDKKNTIRTWLLCQDDGVPIFRLSDENGVERVFLHIQPDGTPRLSLGTEAKVVLTVLEEAEPLIVIYDKEGQPKWLAP